MTESKNILDSQTNSDNSPIVSVACMTFNHRDFIKDTLNGFLIQKTTFPIEIIIHDDASTDGTTEIIKEYAAKYPHIIKPIYQIENQYSKRIDIAKTFVYPRLKGKYFAICEGDDYWIDPLKLQKQVDFLEQNEEYGLVYTEIDRVDEKGEIIDRSFLKNDSASFCETFEDYLIHAPFRAPCTWLFRRSLYIKDSAKNYAVADFPLFLDIIAKSKVYKLNETTTNYRVLDNSASHFTDMKRTYYFLKSVYQIQMDYAHTYNVSKNVIDTIRIKHAWISYNFAVAHHDVDQIEIANRLLKGHPNVTCKFKIIQILSKFRIGREIVKFRLNKILRYS